jgi:HEAT repeat protein
MNRCRAVWLGIGLIALAAVALLVPGSPLSLHKLIWWDGHYDGHFVNHWIHDLKSPDSSVRVRAVRALGAIGPAAADAVPELVRILRDEPTRVVRVEASHALSKMGPAARSAVPALAEALADKEPLVRMNAVMTLSKLRTEAWPAVPALIRALKDRGNRIELAGYHIAIQDVMAMTLGRASAGHADAVPALTAVVETAITPSFRKAAIHGLGEVGAEASAAVPLLRGLLQDEYLGEAAADALEKITGAAPGG